MAICPLTEACEVGGKCKQHFDLCITVRWYSLLHKIPPLYFYNKSHANNIEIHPVLFHKIMKIAFP